MSGLRGVAATARQAVFVVCVLLSMPVHALAQGIEISGGVVWLGGYDSGTLNATETANSSTGGSPITLFTSSSRVTSTTGVDVRAGVGVGSRLAVEGTFQFAQPQLRTSLGSDFENALPETAVGTFSSYVVGGSLVYHFGSGRIVPFVLGGGGYLRYLDEDNAELVTGNEAHGGGGVKIWLDGNRHFGVRADAQVSSRSKSPGFEQKRQVLPAVSAGVMYRF